MTDTLRDRVPDSVPDDIELYEKSDGAVYGRDEHGEFKLDPMRGSPTPPNPDDYQYEPCGHVCKYTYERYGQTRYCEGMAGTNFGQDFDTCKHHKSRQALMERAHELFKHGHFATNYVNFAEKLSPSKFVFAVEMLGGLFEQSRYDFDVEVHTRTIDTSESHVIAEDAVTVGLPVPTNSKYSLQASELLQAALAEVELNNMREVVFDDEMEVNRITDAASDGVRFTDTISQREEHHLHLPISRLSGDIRDHLKTGGVEEAEDDGGTVTFANTEYTLDVHPDDGTEAEDASDVQKDFAESLKADDDLDTSFTEE